MGVRFNGKLVMAQMGYRRCAGADGQDAERTASRLVARMKECEGAFRLFACVLGETLRNNDGDECDGNDKQRDHIRDGALTRARQLTENPDG